MINSDLTCLDDVSESHTELQHAFKNDEFLLAAKATSVRRALIIKPPIACKYFGVNGLLSSTGSK